MGISLVRLSQYKEFYIWLKRERRESSCRAIISTVCILLNFCPVLSHTTVTDFIYKLQLEGKRGSYINHFIDACKVYSRFLKETGREIDPEVFKLKHVKTEEVNKATMSDGEIEQFLTLPPYTHIRKHKSGVMMTVVYDRGYGVWTLFFTIMAYSGMRPTEVAHLKIDDVDFGRNVFVLSETKTTARLVPIAQNLIPLLSEHLTKCTEYLFPSKRGGNNNGFGQVVDSVDWGYNFKTRIERLGIKRRNLSPYSLRHSFITRLLGEDINIFKVQKIVGHKRIETTNMYTHLTTKDIQKAILKDPLYTRSSPCGKLAYIKDILAGLLVENQDGLNMSMKDSPNSVKFEASVLVKSFLILFLSTLSLDLYQLLVLCPCDPTPVAMLFQWAWI